MGSAELFKGLGFVSSSGEKTGFFSTGMRILQKKAVMNCVRDDDSFVRYTIMLLYLIGK